MYTLDQCHRLLKACKLTQNFNANAITVEIQSLTLTLGHQQYLYNVNKASQAIQSPRTVPFFLLVSLLDGYSFPNVLVKNIVAFKH